MFTRLAPTDRGSIRRCLPLMTLCCLILTSGSAIANDAVPKKWDKLKLVSILGPHINGQIIAITEHASSDMPHCVHVMVRNKDHTLRKIKISCNPIQKASTKKKQPKVDHHSH